MRIAWDAGVALTGISAGSICWHVGGTTDSFGPELRPVTGSEEQRRPLFRRLIGEGTLPPGYATGDGAGVLYRGTDFAEAISEHDGAAAYFVDADGEIRLDTRRL